MQQNDKDSGSFNPYDMGVEFMSPSKMLVESATMIFIISFFLCCFTLLISEGSSLTNNELMFGIFGLFFTFMVAVRQYASFR